MKYRKKPVVVEAVQLDTSGPHKTALPDGVTGVFDLGGADNWDYEGSRFFVTTIQGQRVEVKRGEWIITEPDGIHHYPCDPAVFEATYEPVA
jgi:hypothetical protein